LMSASYEMVKRTKEDLYNYFGIATDMGHKTGLLDTKRNGCTTTGTSGYTEITLSLSGSEAQKNALEALKIRLTESIKGSNSALSAADVSKLVDEKLKKTETVRNYLLESLKKDVTVTAKTESGGKPLVGFMTENVATGMAAVFTNPKIVANPYTFFVRDGGSLTEAIQASSSRAKAALSPGLQLLHEFVHAQSKFIS